MRTERKFQTTTRSTRGKNCAFRVKRGCLGSASTGEHCGLRFSDNYLGTEKRFSLGKRGTEVTLSWMDQIGGLLQQYGGAGAAPAQNVESHFDQVAQVAPQSALAERLAAAFGSSQTPAAASMVSQLFGQSNSQQ